MKKRGFFLFCLLVVLLLGVSIWVAVSPEPTPTAPLATDVTTVKQDIDVPNVRETLQTNAPKTIHPTPPKQLDDTLLIDSLENGSILTQDAGERGSLEGALLTDTPMVYAESKYDRLPNSSLLIFTDDMIWKNSENDFSAKKDALQDQAKHIQEASIALSVSPRVEMGKTTGYRLVEIPENTLFAKMGMVSGDVIVSINGGKPDMESMALMFVNMAAGKFGQSTIVVDHRGVERSIQLKAAE